METIKLHLVILEQRRMMQELAAVTMDMVRIIKEGSGTLTMRHEKKLLSMQERLEKMIKNGV